MIYQDYPVNPVKGIFDCCDGCGMWSSMGEPYLAQVEQFVRESIASNRN
jgi:hypothetical protein